MTLPEALVLITCTYVLSVSTFYVALLVLLYIERRRVFAALKSFWAFLEAVEGRGV